MLGFTQSKHLEIFPASDDPEYDITKPGALFVVTRQLSRLLMMKTLVPPDLQHVFFFRGPILTNLVVLDPSGEKRFRSVPEYAGDIVVSPFQAEVELPIAACTPDVHPVTGPDPSVTSFDLASGAVFQHVGMSKTSNRGLFLSSGQRLTIHVIAMGTDGVRRNFAGEGLPSGQSLRTSNMVGNDYNVEPFNNMGTEFKVTFRLVPIGTDVTDDPADAVEKADGKNHFPDGTIEGTVSKQILETHIEWHAVITLSGYYRIVLVSIEYTIRGTPSGHTTLGKFPPLVARAVIEAGLHVVDTGKAAPTTSWKVVTPPDLDGRDPSILDKARCTGVGLLVKNNSNLLNVGGMFFCRRSLSSSMQNLRAATAIVENQTREVNSGNVKAINGMYTWLPPTQDDEKFNTYVDKYGIPIYYPDLDSPQHVMRLELPGDSLTNSSFFMIQNFNMEFSTPLQRYGPSGITTFGVDELSKLRHHICMYPLFLDNPIHVRKLVQSLKEGARGGVNFLRQNQALLQPIANLAGPTAGNMFTMMRMLMGTPS